MKTERTKGVWSVEKDNLFFIEDVNQRRIVQAYSMFLEKGEGEANAVFICTAVNSHDALVEALQDLTERAQRCQSILRDRKGAENSWNMLDTEKASELLASLKNNQ